MKEIYKPIKGYEDLYEISNMGNVKSKDRIINCTYKGKPITKNLKGKQIVPHISSSGYYCVGLHKDNKITSKYIHRLVAETFINNPNNKSVVNHKDENKLNNHIENLEWCSYEYNNNYGTKRNRLRDSNLWRSRPVEMYDLNGNLIKTYTTLSSVKEDGLDVGAVWRCCNGRNKTHKNYTFKYNRICF